VQQIVCEFNPLQGNEKYSATADHVRERSYS